MSVFAHTHESPSYPVLSRRPVLVLGERGKGIPSGESHSAVVRHATRCACSVVGRRKGGCLESAPPVMLRLVLGLGWDDGRIKKSRRVARRASNNAQRERRAGEAGVQIETVRGAGGDGRGSERERVGRAKGSVHTRRPGPLAAV